MRELATERGNGGGRMGKQGPIAATEFKRAKGVPQNLSG